MSDPVVHTVKIRLCSLCLSGAGGQCQWPGCALWLNRAPDLPISPLIYEDLDRPDWAEVQRAAFEAIGGKPTWVNQFEDGSDDE